jgi:hypothetical protein
MEAWLRAASEIITADCIEKGILQPGDRVTLKLSKDAEADESRARVHIPSQDSCAGSAGSRTRKR